MRGVSVPSAAELARRSKVKAVTMRAYLASRFDPPLDVCERMGAVLGVSGKWIFDGTPPRFSPGPDAASEVRLTRVPLLDEVTAGRLKEPNSQIPAEKVPLLAFADLGPGEWFALTVNGTSMDRISPDGSVIVVNKRDRALVSGLCYVFALAGETTYKRWQGGDPPYLEPYSTDAIHKPIFVKRRRDFEVIGRVKRTVLDL